MRWRREVALGIFPVLAAIYPVIALAAGNAGARSFVGWERAAAGAALAGAAAWALSALLTRDTERRMLAALAFVVWFSAFGAGERALGVTGGAPRAAVLAGSLLLLGAAVRWVTRTRRALDTPARIARLTAALLPAIPLLTLGAARMREPEPAAAPKAAALAPADPSLPSIYLIVLDKYTGTRSLAAYHGYDNTPAEARLRRMGFTVGKGASPNYPHTWLSLPSLLNWRYVDEIVAGEPQREWTAALRRSLDDNRTARFLRERGYEYVFVPSTFPFTDASTLADRVVGAARRGGIDLWGAWLAETPLRMLPARSAGDGAATRHFPYAAETATEMEAKLDAIAGLAGGTRPRFVFAHLLIPHEPYVFNADCSHRPAFWPATDYGPDARAAQAAYLQQITCVNRLLERLAGRILQRSRVPPVILFQADHGHAFITLNPGTGAQLPRARLRPEQVAERMDGFAAYHLPGGGAAALYEGMTAVNLLPAVLNHYLDAGIPLREDRVYWATLHPPFDLERLR